MIKYIFSINTGRSGSHYLSEVLSHFHGISSNHEPNPRMNGIPMMEFLKGNDGELKKLMPLKVKNIKKSLEGNSIYTETSHLFIKGFGWLVPEYFSQKELGVILLKRDKQEIIESFYRIQCTPLSFYGRKWVMFPSMKNPVNQITKIDLFKYRILYLINRVIRTGYNPLRFLRIEKWLFKNYEKNLINWYIDETYAQGERFKREFPEIKVFETSLSKLNCEEEFKKMFDFFEIDFKPKKSFSLVLNRRTNLRR